MFKLITFFTFCFFLKKFSYFLKLCSTIAETPGAKTDALQLRCKGIKTLKIITFLDCFNHMAVLRCIREHLSTQYVSA